MLTDNQMKFLKYVYKPKTIKQVLKKFKLKNYTEINDLFDNPVTYFTYSNDKLDNNTKISLTISGRADVDYSKRVFRKFWIPTVISIIALLKSFSEELALLLKLLMQLLK